MAKDAGNRPAAEAALEKAFKVVEDRPIPPALVEHVDRLTASQRRADRRS
jgi:hypothetical protein